MTDTTALRPIPFTAALKQEIDEAVSAEGP